MTSNNHKTPGPARADSFKMWAGDEKVYGPVDVDTLHQWIQDERLFPETFVQCQSDSCWRRAEDVEILREKFTVTPLAAAAAHNGITSTAAALREFPFFAGLTNEGLEQVAALGKAYESKRASSSSGKETRATPFTSFSPVNYASGCLSASSTAWTKRSANSGAASFSAN